MSRWTKNLVYFAYRALIKSSEFNSNFSLIRAFFDTLEADFDAYAEAVAAVLGNCIINGATVTAKGGMTVGIGDGISFAGGRSVVLAGADYTVPTPASGTCIVAAVFDSSLETPGIIFLQGDTATPTTPPALTEYQTIIFSASVAAGQSTIDQSAIDYSLRVDAASLGAEIDAARVSSLYGSFATLDERLENIESEVKAMDFRPGSKAVSQLSGANSANTITLAAQVGKVHKIFGYLCMIKDAASVSSIDITITDDGTVVWSDGIKVATPINDGPGFAFAVPIQSIAADKTMVISATAGGSAVKTQLSVFYDTVDA